MYCKRLCYVVFAAVALVLLQGAMGGAALAEEPTSQWRMFGWLLPAGATESECPDLEAPTSVALIEEDHQTNDDWSFELWEGDPDEPYPLGGTVWFSSDAMHVTKGGVQKLAEFFWEGDAPPRGTVALTGPEGNAVFFACYRIKYVDPAEYSGAHSGLWKVDEYGTDGFLFCVGMGLFSK